MRALAAALLFALALLAAALAACAPAEEPPLVIGPLSYEGYLTQDIPPCTPEEVSGVDPCGVTPIVSGGGSTGDGFEVGELPRTIRYYLDGQYGSVGYTGPAAQEAHLVLRGTYLTDTVRCTVRHLAERGERWATHTFSHVNDSDSYVVDCYADVRVNSYIVGTGPSELTLLYMTRPILGRAPAEHAEWVRGLVEAAAVRGDNYLSLITGPEGGIGGREAMLFIGPPMDFSHDLFQVYATWGMEKKEDDTVVVVHPLRDPWRDRFSTPTEYASKIKQHVEMTVAEFTRRAQAAQTARLAEYGGRIGAATTLPQLITDANKLAEFYTAAGNTGARFGAPPACGKVVDDQLATPQLMKDCIALLEGKDQLRGTATLNWSLGNAMSTWDGITTDGTSAGASGDSGTSPTKVTKVELTSEGLTGSVPESLADMEITTLKLAGNTLTGCIPPGLRDVATNDLLQLNLLYCSPNTPTLTAGTPTLTSVPLSWTSVANTSAYRVEYSDPYAATPSEADWKVSSSTLTTTSHTVTGLLCEVDYLFRVSAKGSGTIDAASWSDPSPTVLATTVACLPVFSEGYYEFDINENVSVGSVVGAVSATDPNNDTLTYSIIAGNDSNVFAISSTTGSITVAGTVNYEAASSHTLTVQVSDGTNAATVEVVITVRSVNDAPVFGQEAYAFSVAENASQYSVVGTVAATDADGDTPTYHITAGNGDGKFSIDLNAGFIVVRGALDYETASSYALTVEARDGKGGVASATVTITVTDAAE